MKAVIKNMCQAYEAEKKFIIASDEIATFRGFVAARKGKLMDSNPFYSSERDYHKAWNFGWESWHEKSLPWALDSKYRQMTGAHTTGDIKKRFKENGELPNELVNILEGYNY